MQNGKLFSGDIYSNIVISAPWLTQSDAWDAAEKAGIAEDIRRMPMGMNTIISEGSGGISGVMWPLFFTVVYYLIFNGVLTLLFGRLEKRMARFSL